MPDFAHALIKGHGVFLSPVSPAAPAKLRLAYECAALAMLSVWAGGAAVGQDGDDISDVEVRHQRTRRATGGGASGRPLPLSLEYHGHEWKGSAVLGGFGLGAERAGVQLRPAHVLTMTTRSSCACSSPAAHVVRTTVCSHHRLAHRGRAI